MDIEYLLLFLMRLDAFVCSLFTCVLFLCLSSSFCSGVRRYVLLTYYTCFQPAWRRITSCFTFTKDNVDSKLLSLNVRGIRLSIKRKALFMWLTRQKADIIFLQETYSTKEVEDIWNTKYKGKSFYSHGTNHSCGVMILIKDDLEFEYK